MQRRQFLQISLACSVISLPFLVSCGSGTSSNSDVSNNSTPTHVSNPKTKPVIQANLGTKSVARYLVDFAEKSQIPVISTSTPDWLQGLSGKQRDIIHEKVDEMKSMGFTEYTTAVYNFNDVVYFFGMSKANGPDACVPFMAKKAVSLIEGPALVGISLAGIDWNIAQVSAADALFPLKAYQTEISDFNTSSSKPFVYDTNAGTLSLNYLSDQRGSGEISLIAQDKVGGRLFEQNYNVNWS